MFTRKHMTILSVRCTLYILTAFSLGARECLAEDGETLLPIYLKAGATGDGSGDNWENACSSVADAVALANETCRPVYAARGLYFMSSGVTVTNNVSIYGGFAGVSMDETLAMRNPEKYQTIFTRTSDISKLKWTHHVPQSGQFSITATTIDATEHPVTKQDADGFTVFNPPPAYDGDYDGYSISGITAGNIITVAKNAGAKIDGITFIGYNYVISVKSINDIYPPREITNCKFYGGQSITTPKSDFDSNDKLTLIVRNCDIRYSDKSAAVFIYGRHTLLEDCRISDHFRTGVAKGGQVVWLYYLSCSFRGCEFTRCVAISSASGESDTNYSSSNLIGWEAASRMPIENCIISNNLSMSQYGYGCPLIAPKSSTIRGSLICNNRLEVKAVSNGRYPLIAAATRNGAEFGVDGCLFMSNTVAEVSGEVSKFALGMVGTGADKASVITVINSTFFDNQFSVTDGSAKEAVFSQGILYTSSPNIQHRAVALHCAFLRTNQDEHIYDIAQVGDCSAAIPVINSIFSRGTFARYNPFYFEKTGMIKVRCCSIGGMLTVPDGLDADEVESIPVPMEKVILPNGVISYRPSCKMPSLRDTVQIATNSYAANATTPYLPIYNTKFQMIGDDGVTWVGTPNGTANKNYINNPISDAGGVARTMNAYTRGPVQTLSDAAEAGNSLIFVSHPYAIGAFSPAYWQVVTPGSGSQPVTAVLANPEKAKFSYWQTPDGIVDSETLSLASVGEGVTIVTGHFDTAKIKLTFSLGEYGLFDNGKNLLELEVAADQFFPEISVADNEDYVFVGWEPELPDFVSSTNATYVGKFISKSVRTIYLVPADDELAAGGAGDGTSWANAYRGDLETAYKDAARYRGEVWIKKGVYEIKNSIELKSNVRIIGGFIGNETSADAADPVRNVTVITGDKNRDNYYKINNSTKAGLVFDYEKMVFNEPKPANRTTYWTATGANSDDVDQAFYGSSITTNCVLEGVTIVGFGKVAISSGDNVALKMIKCRMIGNNSKYQSSSTTGGMVVYGLIHAEDCDFLAMHTPLALLQPSTATYMTNILRRCRFRYTYGSGSGSGGGFIVDTGKRDLILDGCEFSDSYFWEYQGFQRWSVEIVNVKDIKVFDSVIARNTYTGRSNAAFQIDNATRVTIERCVIRDNLKSGFGKDNGKWAAALRIVKSGAWDLNNNSVIRDCFFENNQVINQSGADGVSHASALSFVGGILAIVNCSFVGNFTDTTSAKSGNGATVVISGKELSAIMINCVFDGNVVTGLTTCDMYNYSSYPTDGVDISLMIFNTVFNSDFDGYEPLIFAGKAPFMAAHCRIPGYTPEKYIMKTHGFDINNSSSRPSVAKMARQGTNGAIALPVKGVSGQGAPVYLGSDGFYYVAMPQLDATKQYIRINTTSALRKVAEVPGLKNGTGYINRDAWGNAPANRKGRPSLGPVNVKDGFVIKVR